MIRRILFFILFFINSAIALWYAGQEESIEIRAGLVGLVIVVCGIFGSLVRKWVGNDSSNADDD